MSNTLIRRLVEIFIGLFLLGGLIAIIRGVASAISGGFGRVEWPINTDTPMKAELVSDGLLKWSHGTLIVEGQPLAHLLDIATDLAVLALLVVVLLAVRRFLLALAKGEVFTDQSIADMRKIGLALIAICVISVVDAVVIQSIIMANAELPEGLLLHPSISWNAKNVENIWMDYDVPVFTFILGGLALLATEAFKSGQAYREDSESVV